jgi:protoporphyrin/coproporphyrin ferrochelatase
MKQAILLLAHGTPDTVAGVPEFLRNVTGGRPLPEAAIAEIQHRYSLIGHSPLTEITARQAQTLARRLDLPVYVGMRNWHPYIADSIRQMAADGVQSAVAICLAPQNSGTSVGLYRRALAPPDATPASNGNSRGTPKAPLFPIAFVESWHDHPLLVNAFAERLLPAWTACCQEMGAAAPIIFTAHSVPAHTVSEGDPYESQARQTAELVAAQVPDLPRDAWRFAFQSQGISGGPWIGPTVEETIADLQQLGHRGVFVQPVGFLSDHVEVLYDIDIAFRNFAAARGIRLWRAPSLNDSPILASALADLARVHLAEAAKMKAQKGGPASSS